MGADDALELNRTSLPNDIFNILNRSKYFLNLDLEIELDQASKILFGINTHWGLFQYQSLPFGIKSAPSILQKLMDQMLAGIEGVVAYLNDVVIAIKTNYYLRYIKEIRNLRLPLDALLKYDAKFKWTKECKNSVNKFKEILGSSLLLSHYDPTKPIIVSADASKNGIDATISHIPWWKFKGC